MEIAVTKGIKVSVVAEFQPFYSDPERYHFAFSYRIRIENHSDATMKLLKKYPELADHDTIQQATHSCLEKPASQPTFARSGLPI